MKAFPNYEWHEAYKQMMPTGGMDLRDYFAAQAMQALLSQGTSPANSKALAIVVYDVADKMMEERNIK